MGPNGCPLGGKPIQTPPLHPTARGTVDEDWLTPQPAAVRGLHCQRHAADILQKSDKLLVSHLRQRQKFIPKATKLQGLATAGVFQTAPGQVQGRVALAGTATPHQDAPQVASLQERDKGLGRQELDLGHMDDVGHVMVGHLTSYIITLSGYCVEVHAQLEQRHTKAGIASPQIQNKARYLGEA